MTIRRVLLWALLLFVAQLPLPAHGQSPVAVFVSFDNFPFGPGARDMTARIKLQPGETTANIEAWVIYDDRRDAVVNGQLNGAVPHGKARLGAADSAGVVTVTFIFPHSDSPTPNLVDRNPQRYRSGKKLYYKWVKRKGNTQVASDIVEFRLPDKFTVVNFGDSYASGEGAPYTEGPKWGPTGEQCHRSSNSGQAKAVKEYKRAHPETVIAFLNVACSGAGVFDGILNSQKKPRFLESGDFPTRARAQYEQAKEWLAQNGYEQMNLAIISIGGNDINFGPLVTNFFIEPGNLADPNDAGARRARENTLININETIPKYYDELKRVFDGNFDYDRVLVTAYPDPTRDRDGHFCGKPLTLYGLCWGPVEALNGQKEFEYAFTDVLTKMNNKIKESVRAYPHWLFLDGTVAKAQRNGICNCDVPYFNTIGASLADQNDVFGTMHPNRRGHAKIYLPVVLEALEGEIVKIRREYARERAVEIAKERSRRKTEMAAAQSRIVQSPVVRPVIESNPPISSQALQKAREAAAKTKRVDDVRDERHDDDHEK